MSDNDGIGQNSGNKPHRVEIPNEAADEDLIEKEWVEKAKEIIEHTRDNPHEQQRAFSKMKEEYLRKRFSKEPKSDDDLKI